MGESDVMLVLLSPRGRLDCMVRGGLKSKRWRGLIEPLSLLDAQFAQGRSFAYMREANMLSGFVAIREDYELLQIAGYWVDLCCTMAEPQQDTTLVFRALVWVLKLLGESGPRAALNFWLELKLLAGLGVSPGLGACVGCGSEDPIGWDPARGGLVCARCRVAHSLSPLAVTVLRALSRCPAQSLQDLRIPREETRQIYIALRAHFFSQVGESARVLGAHAEIGELLWKEVQA